MRILLISDSASIHTQRWVQALAGEGIEVHLASFTKANLPGCCFHLLRTFGVGKVGYFFAIPQLRRISCQVHPDIVHAHHLTSYGFLAARAGLSPLVVTAWGSDVLLSPKESRIMRSFVKRALQAADLVTVVAEHMKPSVMALGAHESRIRVLPFGVDLESFPWRSPSTDRSDPIHLICTRGFKEVYDIPTFIRGLALLCQRGFSFKALLVGERSSDGRIEMLLNGLGLKDMVTFGGRMNPIQMSAALAAADIFVSPSLSDGNNISLNEAMASGTIPVVSRIPANEAWLEEGNTGFFFAPGDEIGVAAAIERAIAARDRWPEISLLNREVIRVRGDWRRCVETMKGFYLGLMSGGSQ